MKSNKQTAAPSSQRPASAAPARRQPRSPAPQSRQAVPAVLQRKPAGVAQARTGAAQRHAPAAPPAYRPQAAPRCLQPKAATGRAPSPAQKSTPQGAQKSRTPAAPPAYRPQPVPKVLQRKEAGAQTPPDARGTRRTPAAPPAYRPQPVQKCLQAKPALPRPASTTTPKRVGARDASRPGRPQPPNGARAAVQAKFTLGGIDQTIGNIDTWYGANPGMAGKPVPSTHRPMLQILVDAQGETFTLESFNAQPTPPAALVKFLKEREQELRPGVMIYDAADKGKWHTYGGKLNVEKPGVLTNWNLDGHSALSASPKGKGYTELAHVAFKSSYFADKAVSTAHGSNPGEFGFGFYLTTAHDVEAASTVSQVWKPEGKAAPNDVVKFRIPNDQLGDMVGRIAELRDFLIYVLQNKSGYPVGMSEDAAVALMDRINAQGEVLIFPDDKDRRVVIKTGQPKKNWREYTDANAGASGHSIVIGPQRPGGLDGVRQVAVRGGRGQLFINSLSRSLQTIDDEVDPK